MMADTALVRCTVLEVQPVNAGRILALASVEVEIDGVVFVVEGVQVVRVPATRDQPERTGVDLPRYRNRQGAWRPTLKMPEEVRQPLGDAILERCCEMGITRRLAAIPVPLPPLR